MKLSFASTSAALFFDTYGSGALTLVNVTMTANTTIYGDGSGFAMYNSTCDGAENTGTGSLEIDTSSFTNNTTAGYGGAILGGDGGCINSVLNTVTLSGNSTNASLNNSVEGNAGTFTVTLETHLVAFGTTYSTTVVAVTGPNSYSQSYTATSSRGVATFNLSSVPLTGTGSYTYTASSTGLTSATATEVVNPGAAASLSVMCLSTFTAPQMSGTATVRALGAYGNVATGFTGMVTLTSTDALAAFSPTSYTYTTADAGTHNFTVTLNTAGTQTVTANSGALNGSETGILVEDSIIVLNSNSTLVRTTDAGVQTTAFGSPNSTTTLYGAVAFDSAGDIWTVSNATNAVQEYTKSGTAVTVSGGSPAGVVNPMSLFIDGIGQVWVANGNNSVSVLNNAGAAVSPSTGYQSGNLSMPSGIVVDSAGSVWVTNRGNNSVSKILGAATPVVTPTVTGTTNKTLGTRP
jgi:predicted outer membrane repeat protein